MNTPHCQSQVCQTGASPDGMPKLKARISSPWQKSGASESESFFARSRRKRAARSSARLSPRAVKAANGYHDDRKVVVEVVLLSNDGTEKGRISEDANLDEGKQQWVAFLFKAEKIPWDIAVFNTSAAHN